MLLVGLSMFAAEGSRNELGGHSPGDDRHVGRIPSWKSGEHTIMVDGRERTFLLEMPESLQPGAALVLVFHGFTDSAKSIRNFAGFTPLVAQCGFVAVYLQGTQDAKGRSFFNVGYAFHKDMKVDDVKFTRELAARLVKDLALDPHSVFATGMSNGGDMCYLLARQPQPVVRAIAPVAGCMMSAWTNGLAASARPAVMEVHGTGDQTTLWKGDPLNRDGWGAYLGTEAVMDFWVRRLSLEKAKTIGLGTTVSKEEKNLPIRWHRWWTAADKTEVRLYEIQGGGHDWPSDLGDPQTSTAADIWNFFQLHRP